VKLIPRLLTLGLALPTGSLALAMLLLGYFFRQSLLEDVDRRLLAQAAVESVSLFDGPDQKPHLHLHQSPLARDVAFLGTTSALYDPRGHLLLTAPTDAPAPDHIDPTPTPRPRFETRDDHRELIVSVPRANEGSYTLHLATSLGPVRTTMALFYRAGAFTGGLLALALASLLYAQASRLSARVRELVEFVPRLRASQPHAGPIAPGDDELAELGQVLVETSQHIHAQQASQERFLANAAHQLRTPLTVIRTEIDLALRRERPQEQLRDALARTRTEVDRLALLARKLLDFESLRVRPVQVRSVDLGELLHDTLTRMAIPATERGVSLVEEIAPRLTCRCDPLLVAQAVENIIDNAIRFAPRGSSVLVRASREGASHRVTIHDDGPGIPPAERPRLFEPFHRGSSAGAQTGLGLAFASEVLLKHGGAVLLDELDAPGTTFRVELPASPP